MKVGLFIAHCPWIAERITSMDRLRAQVQGQPWSHYEEVTDRGPNWLWSERMWKRASETDADLCLFANDDIEVCPEVHAVVKAVAEAFPGQVISFHSFHEASRALLEEQFHAYTTSDCLVGTLYAMPRELLLQFLAWRDSALVDDAAKNITEDTLISLWCMVTGKKIVRPVPGIFRHDTELPSTYANDEHLNRNPAVHWSEELDWKLEDLKTPAFWSSKMPPHFGVFYGSMPNLARAVVKGFTDADRMRCLLDDGQSALKRLRLGWQYRHYEEPKARVMIATPTRGSGHPHYFNSVWSLLRFPDVSFINGWEVASHHQWNDDIVLCRSKFVRMFLESSATHLWFIDSDQSFEPRVLSGMLSSGRDVVCAPYPRRDHIEWKKVDPRRKKPDALAYRFQFKVPEKIMQQGGFQQDDILPGAVVEICGIGLGCCLLSRAVLERMVEHYRGELEFEEDSEPGQIGARTVALFMPMIRDDHFHGEDMSFFRRLSDMGEKSYLYVGDGTPIAHHGTHTYQGSIETLGLARSA